MINRSVLTQFVDSLNHAEDYNRIHSVCEWFCDHCGFDNFHYGAQIPASLSKPSFIHISGYPAEWWEHYVSNNLIAFDPTVIHCAKNILPFDWNVAISKSLKGKVKGPDVMMDARAVGLKTGMSIPLHDANGVSSMLSFSTSGEYAQDKDKYEWLQPYSLYITAVLHESVMRVARLQQDESLQYQKVLTDREKECLLWSAEGKTSWEVGQILNISENTVIFHCKNASKKLNVSNRSQAVARAISLGIITPQYN